MPPLPAVLLTAALAAAPASEAPPAVDLSQAVALRTISQEELEWLEPRHDRLPPHPRSLTDYTAYSLEWGEVELGLNRITAGVLPRTQMGTAPALDLIGIQNASAKVDFLRAGPVDLAVDGSHHRLPLGEFLGYRTSVGGVASVRITPRWGIHGGGHYAELGAHGLPDLSRVSPVVQAISPSEIWAYDLASLGPDAGVAFRASTVTARAAIDFGVNRRDTVILQGQAMLWGSLDSNKGEHIPPVFGLDEALTDRAGAVPIQEAYVASLAYNASWRRAQLRVGAGVSSVPAAWLLQATELSWHFGGKTLREERAMQRGWRRNCKQIVRSY